MKKILILFFLIWKIADAQSPRFDHFNVSNGLSQNFVFSLDIDQRGNVWIGTLDGLNKFNGYNFEVFKPNSSNVNSIKGNIVTAIKTDSNGDVWLSTSNGGLNKYNSKTAKFQYYPTSKKYSAEGINAISISKNGNVWVQSIDNVDYFDTKTSEFLSYNSTKNIKGICSYKDNSAVVFGEFGLEEIKFEGKRANLTPLKISSPVYWLKKFNDQFYIALESGIFKCDSHLNITQTIIDFKQESTSFLPSSISMVEITETDVWVGTTSGLYVYELNKTARKKKFKQHYLISENITKLKIDTAQNLWIGTAKNGVFVYNKHKNLFRKIDFDTDIVSSICKVQSEDLWIGTVEKGITVLKKDGAIQTFENYFNEKGDSKSLKDVRCIFEDSQGNIWIGNKDAICMYNQQKNRLETLNCNYSWDWPYACFVIKELDKGIITLTGNNKIATFNLNSKALNFLKSEHNGVALWAGIRDVIRDKNDNLWVAQNNYGLVKITKNPLKYTRLLKGNSNLSDNKVYSFEIQGDRLWIATNSGLNLMDINTNTVVKKYLKKDGLSSDVVYGVHLDESENIWMSTNNGISKLNTKTAKISTYLQNEIFSDDAYSYLKNGTIFYGGNSDITWFDAKSISKSNFKPIPVIENLQLFNQLVEVNDTLNGNIILKKNINESEEITLNYDQNSVTFLLNAYPFTLPNTSQFRFRLIGLNSEWSVANNAEPIAVFNDLEPGSYIFEVQTATQDGEWSLSKQLKIEIKSVFWMELWVVLSVLAMLLLLIVLFSRIKGSKKTANKKLLKLEEEPVTNEFQPLKRDEEFWNSLMQILEENFHKEEFNMEELSTMLHMSRSTFYRRFKDVTGLNAASYLRSFRLKKAAQLLKDENLDITQVSMNAGFKSISQFRLNFKSEFGKTPSEFRKED